MKTIPEIENTKQSDQTSCYFNRSLAKLCQVFGGGSRLETRDSGHNEALSPRVSGGGSAHDDPFRSVGAGRDFADESTNSGCPSETRSLDSFQTRSLDSFRDSS